MCSNLWIWVRGGSEVEDQNKTNDEISIGMNMYMNIQ